MPHALYIVSGAAQGEGTKEAGRHAYASVIQLGDEDNSYNDEAAVSSCSFWERSARFS